MYSPLRVIRRNKRQRGFNSRIHDNILRTEALTRRVVLWPHWFGYQASSLRTRYWPTFKECQTRKSAGRIAADLVRETYRWKCLPFHYFMYGLYRSSVPRHAADDFLPESVLYYRILPRTNTACVLLDDKVVAKSIIENRGIPQPRTVMTKSADALWGQDWRRIHGQEELAEALAAETGRLLLKPASFSSGGKGRAVFAKAADGDYRSRDGQLLDWQLLSSLPSKWLLEECVDQPDWLKKLYPGSLNTFRLLTMLTEDGPVVLSCTLKCGADGNPAANLHSGGVAVAVDLNTGKLTDRAVDWSMREHTTHPTTGVSFAGLRVPNVESLSATALACAEAFPDMTLVGWDISLDAQGKPVVLEGNSSPALDATQWTQGGVVPLLDRVGGLW